MCEILRERLVDWRDEIGSESLWSEVNAEIDLMQQPWAQVRRYEYIPSGVEEDMMKDRRNEIGVEGYTYAGDLFNGWAYSDVAQGLDRR